MPLRSRLRAAAPGIVVALAAACSDLPSTPAAPLPPAESQVGQRLACTADVRTGAVRCGDADGSGEPRADRILGQGPFIRVDTYGVGIVADTFAFDLGVANHLPYPIGTSDGQTPDPRGVRVFVVDGIHVVEGTGTVTVANPDGTGTFTGPNQPYFAYLGIVPPNYSYREKRRKLRFSSTVKRFSFGLYVSVPTPALRGPVRATLTSPTSAQVDADSVRVEVRIDSAGGPVTAVQLAVRGRIKAGIRGSDEAVGWRTTLLNSIDGRTFEGIVRLGAFQAGTLQLTAYAFSAAGDTGSVAYTILKDAPAALAWRGPDAGAGVVLATPPLELQCDDDAATGCDSIVVTARTAAGDTRLPVHPGAYPGRWRIVLDPVDEREATLTATAWEGGRTVTLSRTAFIELAPGLTPYMWCLDVALDVVQDMLLCRDDEGNMGAKTQEYAYGIAWSMPARGVGAYAYLRTGGAIYVSRSSGSARVIDSSVGDLGPIDADSSLRTTPHVSRRCCSEWFADQWAIWNVGSTLYRKETELHDAPTVISNVAGSYYNDVAPNGDVVYWTTSHQVVRYRYILTTYPSDEHPGWTQLTDDPESVHWNLYPVTDGDRVVYLKTDQHGSTTPQPGRVTVWKDGVETVLPSLLPDARPMRQYAISYGYVAHVAIVGGVQQVHVIAPDGTERQATFGSSDSEIRAIRWDGALLFASAGSLYAVRTPYTAPPTRLGRDWFRVRWSGGMLLLGNTAVEAHF